MYSKNWILMTGMDAYWSKSTSSHCWMGHWSAPPINNPILGDPVPILAPVRSHIVLNFINFIWFYPILIIYYPNFLIIHRNLLPVLVGNQPGSEPMAPWHLAAHDCPACDVQRDQVGVNMRWKNGASPWHSWHLEMVILDIKKRWFCNQQMLGVPGFEPFAWG